MKNIDYDTSVNGEITFSCLNTGKDWLNVLTGGGGYVTTVTHTGTFTSYAVTKDGDRIDYNAPKAAAVYIRNRDTGEYFNPGGYPCGILPDGYECTHAALYSKISGSKYSLKAEAQFCVAPAAAVQLIKITVTNIGDRAVNADLFAAAVFDLGGYEMPFYYNAPTTSATELMADGSGVVCVSANPYAKMPNKSAFIAAYPKPDYLCGRLNDFTGLCGGLSAPSVLCSGQHLNGCTATVLDRCGITENCFTLKSGESTTVYVALGFCRDAADAVKLGGEVLGGAKSLFDGITELSRKENGNLGTSSPYRQINTVFNGWAVKQIKFCRIGKKAVRDNAQLAAAMLNFDPEAARETIEECLPHQYRDGHSALLWYPVTDERTYADPTFWLISAITEYVKETGDVGFLNKTFGYADGGSGTVYEHIENGVDWYGRPCNYGAHGLFRIFTADWNDALNIPDEQAESVLASEFVCYLYRQMSELYTYLGENGKAEKMRELYRLLADVINKEGYDGEYYIRAISKFGKVGARGCEGGEFYFNTQSWAALGGIIPPDRIASVTAATDRYELDCGVPLCAPCYSRYDYTVGRMSGMLPGVYENGGIYNHAGCFKVMADCALARGEHALKTLLKILPDGVNKSADSGLEPYVFSNCYLMHPSVRGKVASSWQTGTSAWGLRCYYEGILGIRRTFDALTVKPCLPQNSGTITATRTYRGCTLRFTFCNCASGEADVYLDGVLLKDSALRADSLTAGKTYNITVLPKGEKI